jgi:hypothetical protein
MKQRFRLERLARRTVLFVAVALAASAVRAEEKPAENPVATQFRQHLESADKNRDGFVSSEELAAEIGNDPKRDPKTIDQIVSAMFRDLDADHDGRLSPAEIAEGARRAGENANTKQSVRRAESVMSALGDYRKQHQKYPATLQELGELLPQPALRCIVADGHEKPWGYELPPAKSKDENAVVLFSPGKVDSGGQYIVGLADGRVLGLHDTELDLEKVPKLRMRVFPDKK